MYTASCISLVYGLDFLCLILFTCFRIPVLFDAEIVPLFGTSLVAQNIKSPPAMQETGLISCSGRVPGEGHDNSLQHSCLENFMDGGAWRITVHGVAEFDMTE